MYNSSIPIKTHARAATSNPVEPASLLFVRIHRQLTLYEGSSSCCGDRGSRGGLPMQVSYRTASRLRGALLASIFRRHTWPISSSLLRCISNASAGRCPSHVRVATQPLLMRPSSVLSLECRSQSRFAPSEVSSIVVACKVTQWRVEDRAPLRYHATRRAIGWLGGHRPGWASLIEHAGPKSWFFYMRGS